MTEFTADMHDRLRNYVYRLIDPRDGSTFYVGRGSANRVFDHVNDAMDSDCKEDLRLGTIRKLLALGLKPLHVIHRHGMSQDEASLAEAVLIDAFPGLTNILAGEGSDRYGPASAEELAERYGASEMQFEPDQKVMIFKIKWSTVESRERRACVARHDSVYEAVRGHWRVSRRRAEQASLVMAVIEGICRGVYVPDLWKQSSHPEWPGRWEFEGQRAEKETWGRYVGKRLPARLRVKGMASPFLYHGY